MLVTVLPALMAMAGPTLAQPRQLPVLDTREFDAGTFDVRAFDPLGMPERRAFLLAEGGENRASDLPPPQDYAAAQTGQAPLSAASGGAARMAPERGLFTDGWSRNGFGTQR
ncbi:hypothetical protein CR162_17005 [Pseudoroseomonas rhizosphaerae]|uniref:Uncharacterized protein n=1 Tax=Teichococcus rhizosphaerae TaxID=1335062 RepID=A0A2C7AAM9_9PROT|nr:hypothetical protein [Pseudoroseomonas rhizosphaerae]PHK93687.1 hypothetical protein CR162_17005 [Pseudoroseomonas rhizosphaerae]